MGGVLFFRKSFVVLKLRFNILECPMSSTTNTITAEQLMAMPDGGWHVSDACAWSDRSTGTRLGGGTIVRKWLANWLSGGIDRFGDLDLC